jgi:hypothetical protein
VLGVPLAVRGVLALVALLTISGHGSPHDGSFMRPTWRLIDPHVIVIHYTESPTFQSTWNRFASDTPDPELHELPNTCAHFVIDRNGKIYQLVSLGTMCRHTGPGPRRMPGERGLR